MDMKTRIDHVLSDILSDRYGCKVTIRFVPKEEGKAEKTLYMQRAGTNLRPGLPYLL